MDCMSAFEIGVIIVILIISSMTIFINIQTIRINRRIAHLDKNGWKKDETRTDKSVKE